MRAHEATHQPGPPPAARGSISQALDETVALGARCARFAGRLKSDRESHRPEIIVRTIGPDFLVSEDTGSRDAVAKMVRGWEAQDGVEYAKLFDHEIDSELAAIGTDARAAAIAARDSLSAAARGSREAECLELLAATSELIGQRLGTMDPAATSRREVEDAVHDFGRAAAEAITLSRSVLEERLPDQPGIQPPALERARATAPSRA